MDRKLIEKYNKQAPRYTSYPPANFFTEEIGAAEYQQAVSESNQWKPENISFYFHIPFCTKKCHYCGCNAIGMRSADTVSNYINALIEELRMTAALISRDRKVSQVHFGGGTPNALEAESIERIMTAVSELFDYTPNAERAIECNPAYLDRKYIESLGRSEFNRISLGIQDFNAEVLKAVNRDPSALALEELLPVLRSVISGIAINLDFIYGLPLQNSNNFSDTIERAIALKPDRLVTFSYAHLPLVFKAQKILEKFELPSAVEKLNLFESAYQSITTSGYTAIGIDHYALNNDELSIALKNRRLHRNFQGYCTRETTGQVYAFGVSGISQLEGIYAQNTKSIEEYISGIQAGKFVTVRGYKLNEEEKIIRECINELMCNRRLVYSEIAERLQLETKKIKSVLNSNNNELKAFTDDSIIDISEDEISITPAGQFFVRNVAAAIDPLMISTEKKFSQTI